MAYFTFLLWSCLTFAVVEKSPTEWINEIRSAQDAIGLSIQELRSNWYTTKNTEETKKKLRPIMKQLRDLQKDIQKMHDRTFAENSNDWKDVLQQARALQDINLEEAQDLEGELRAGKTN